MGFGNGWKHEDSSEMLEAGNYKAKIVKAEIKSGNYGDYIQAEVEVEGHPNCNPHIFLMNDRPTQGFGSMSVEQAQKMWDRNMTSFFALILCSKRSIFVLWVQHQVIRQSVNDKITVVGAGITLHEALAAADDLSKQGQLGGLRQETLGSLDLCR